MKIRFLDIEWAYEFVCFGEFGGNTAIVDKKTGKIYYDSAFGDSDEIPDEVWDSGDTVKIPHKKDLDLGSRLVFRFVRETIPEGCDKVHRIFSHRGAYAHYKDWLAENDLLDRWHAYENEATTTALREWCAENGIELEG